MWRTPGRKLLSRSANRGVPHGSVGNPGLLPLNISGPRLSPIRNRRPRDWSAWGRIASGKLNLSPESLFSRKANCVTKIRAPACEASWPDTSEHESSLFGLLTHFPTFVCIVSRTAISFQALPADACSPIRIRVVAAKTLIPQPRKSNRRWALNSLTTHMDSLHALRVAAVVIPVKTPLGGGLRWVPMEKSVPVFRRARPIADRCADRCAGYATECRLRRSRKTLG
jgi:hypothetical protein